LVPSLIRSIGHDFHQHNAAFGVYYFIVAIVYGVGALGGGLLTERVGRRSVLTGSAGVLAIGLAGQASASSWILFLLAASVAGLGAGVIDSGTDSLFLDVFPITPASSLNLLHVFFSAGALAAPFTIGVLITVGTNWRVITLGTSVQAVILASLLFRTNLPHGRHLGGRGGRRYWNPTTVRPSFPLIALAFASCFYVAAEAGISNWLVQFLRDVPLATATAALSLFWAGIALGRLVGTWISEHVNYRLFVMGCLALGSTALLAALAAPWLSVVLVLVAATGACYGPVYPMLMALGGRVLPHRRSALAGSLAISGRVGAIVYPALMGLLSSSVGLRAGMIGAGFLGYVSLIFVMTLRASSSRGIRGR